MLSLWYSAHLAAFLQNSGFYSAGVKLNRGSPGSVGLALIVSADVQSPHSGPALSWDICNPAVQNRGIPQSTQQKESGVYHQFARVKSVGYYD
jgi:hypothetical protein